MFAHTFLDQRFADGDAGGRQDVGAPALGVHAAQEHIPGAAAEAGEHHGHWADAGKLLYMHIIVSHWKMTLMNLCIGQVCPRHLQPAGRTLSHDQLWWQQGRQ